MQEKNRFLAWDGIEVQEEKPRAAVENTPKIKPEAATETTPEMPPEPSLVKVERISKSFGTEVVLSQISFSLADGAAYCLMGPSGAGKTPLLRILLGLETADEGRILGASKMRTAAVFQEDRLLEGFTVIENIRFVTGNRFSAPELSSVIKRLLPEHSLQKPVHEFSGGMRRRAAILRAILAPSDFVVMDEPFTGLDRDTKLSAIALIREYCAGKLLLISTHAAEDAKLLDAKILRLEDCSEAIF